MWDYWGRGGGLSQVKNLKSRRDERKSHFKLIAVREITETRLVVFLTLTTVLENPSYFFTPQRQWIAGAPPTCVQYLLRCSNNKKTVHSDKEPHSPESRTLVDVDSTCWQRSHAEGLLVFKDDEDYTTTSLHHLSCCLDCNFHGWVATLF